MHLVEVTSKEVGPRVGHDVKDSVTLKRAHSACNRMYPVGCSRIWELHPRNYPLGRPKYHLIETIRPLI